jgi:hypothetical protein
VVNRLVLQGVALSGAERGGLGDGSLHERGVLAGGAFPADDQAGEGVDHERGVTEPGQRPDIGEVRDQKPVRRRHPELTVDQVRRSGRGRIQDRGADLLGSGRTAPAVQAH